MEQKADVCPHGWLKGLPCGQCDEQNVREATATREKQAPKPRFSEDEVRLMGVGAPSVLKLVRDRQRAVCDRIYAQVKNGNLSLTAELAEYACLRDIETDLTNTLRRFEAAEEQAHANANA